LGVFVVVVLILPGVLLDGKGGPLLNFVGGRSKTVNLISNLLSWTIH
jgi:hypothetical protein